MQGCGCSPEKLITQTRNAANEFNILYAGENALPIGADHQYNQVVRQSKVNGKKIHAFTYLRLTDWTLEPNHLRTFTHFINNMSKL